MKRRLIQSCAVVGLLVGLPGCGASVAGSGGDRGGDESDDDQAQAGKADTDTDEQADAGASRQPSGSKQDPAQPAAPGVPPTFAPKFPGAGMSGDDAPLTNGKLCDYVPANGAPKPDDITKCFFGPNNPTPAATLEQVLECAAGKDVVHIRLSFNPAFVDNTYGTGSIGWPARRGHTWKDLYKSDHAEIVMRDGAGKIALQFKLDYVSPDPMAPSGYATLGVRGGDGSVSLGDAAWIVDASTSIDKNLNERGYGSYIVDSPATDAKYTPNPAAPNWDYRVVYEAWVDVRGFGAAGFGGAGIEYVHASPAKGGSDTIEVKEGECPPPFCTNPDGCDAMPPKTECEIGADVFCEGQPPVITPPKPECEIGADVFCEGQPPTAPPPSPECDGGSCTVF